MCKYYLLSVLAVCYVARIFVQAEVPVKEIIFDHNTSIGHLCGQCCTKAHTVLIFTNELLSLINEDSVDKCFQIMNVGSRYFFFFYFSSANGNFLYLTNLKYSSFSSVQQTLVGPLGSQFLQLVILHSGCPSYLCIQQRQINTGLKCRAKWVYMLKLLLEAVSNFVKQCLSNCMKTKT